jgi:hypothetical protein
MTRDTPGILARRSVARMLRDFITSLMSQFKTPPAELVRRAEEKAQEPARTTEQIEPGVSDRR